jgi:hypothetical protein
VVTAGGFAAIFAVRRFRTSESPVRVIDDEGRINCVNL